MSIKKNILKVFSANFVQMISSIIVGFFVPAILSVNGYADLKTYALYISYIGFFHLGFVDGMYIKYGGKSISNINLGILKGEHNFLVVFQIILSFIFIIIGIVTKDIIIFLFAITILPTIMLGFHQQFNQAIGNFSKYTKILYMYSVSYMVINVILALVFRSENYILYCIVSFISNLIPVIICEYKFYKETKNTKTIINKEILKNIKVGFFILLGNMAVIAFYGIDKWFVKFLFSTETFAYYSFAISMLNLVNILITAVSITFYNYLFSNNKKEIINRLRKYLVIIGGMASASYFVLAAIVHIFIKKYIPALEIVAITFSAFPYLIIIKALFVNLYKINKNEKKYVKVVVGMLIISIIYNIIAYFIMKNAQSIAFATILAFITWYIYSSIDLKNIGLDKKSMIYSLILTIVFLISSHIETYWIGFIIYILTFLCITIIIYKDTVLEIINYVKKFLIQISSRTTHKE